MVSCPACLEPQPEGKRFCGDCGQTLAQVCKRCNTEVEPGKKFCGDCGTPLETEPAHQDSTGKAPKPRLVDERRVVTVLFADISGFTALSEQRDPEDMTQLINRCFKVMTDVVLDHGGVVDKYMGDCVMAVFGAPTAHPDDPFRAVGCAHELHQTIQGLAAEEGINLALSIGVNTGKVLAGTVGDGRAASYTMMGDAVNVAQRLQANSEPGKTLISEATARQVQDRFSVNEMAPLKVKNRTELVHVFHLGTEKSAHSLTQAGPFYARKTELVRLMAAVYDSLEGGNGAWLITGDSGVGKTRLVHQLRKQIEAEKPDGTRWMYGRATGGRTQLGYRPFRDALLAAFSLEDRSPVDVIHKALNLAQENGLQQEPCWYLAQLFGAPIEDAPLGELDPQVRATNMRLMLREVFAWLSRDKPTILWLDDMQWADQATMDVLFHLTDHLEGLALQVFILSRENEAEILKALPGAHMLRLSAWNQEEVAGYLQFCQVPANHAQEMASILLGRTAGLPAFLEAVLQSWRDAGLWQPGQNLPIDAPLPQSLESAYLSRLDSLPTSARDVALMAALLDRTFHRNHLDGLAGKSTSPECALLTEADVLWEVTPGTDSWYTFRTEGLREVASGTHTKTRRREILGNYASILEQEGTSPPDLLASLWKEAGQPNKALPFLVLSAHQAIEESSYPVALDTLEALEQQEHLLNILPEQDRLRVFLDLADTLNVLSQWERGLEVLKKGARFLGGAQPELGTREAYLLRRLGRAEEAQGVAQKTLLEAQAINNYDSESAAWNELGLIAWQKGDIENAKNHYLESLRIRQDTGDLRGEASTVNNLGILADQSGHPDEARGYFHRALEITQETGNRHGEAAIMSNLGTIAAAMVDWYEAQSLFEQALEIRKAIGDRYGEGTSLGNLGEVFLAQGNPYLALEFLEQAQTICDEVGDPDPEFLLYKAEALRAMGHHQEAVKALLHATKKADSFGNPEHIARADLFTGNLHRDQGDLKLARECYNRAHELGELHSIASVLRECKIALNRE